MWDSLDHSAFAAKLGAKFRLCPEDSDPLEVELSEVSGLLTSPHNEQFAIIFRGPLEPALSQGIYRVEHEEKAAFDLFLVPVGVDEGGSLYEAIFNRLVEEEA